MLLVLVREESQPPGKCQTTTRSRDSSLKAMRGARSAIHEGGVCSGTREGVRERARRIKSGRGWWGIHVFETTDGGDDDHRLAQVPDPGALGVAGGAAGNMGNRPFWSPGRRELREPSREHVDRQTPFSGKKS